MVVGVISSSKKKLKVIVILFLIIVRCPIHRISNPIKSLVVSSQLFECRGDSFMIRRRLGRIRVSVEI